MTVFYKLRQDNQERSKYKGQWFAHAVNLGTIETDELARIIERNCSVKRRPCSDPTKYTNDHITGLHLCFKPEKEQRLTDADVAPLPP